MAGRRFYWLKLPEDFFRRSYIRRLRGREDGDRLVLVYLEMLLAALKTEGVLTADCPEDFTEDLALELYEDAVDVETVLDYLSEHGKFVNIDDAQYQLTDCEDMTGSETDSARRKREERRREAEQTLFIATESAPPADRARCSFTDAEFAEQIAKLRQK